MKKAAPSCLVHSPPSYPPFCPAPPGPSLLPWLPPLLSRHGESTRPCPCRTSPGGTPHAAAMCSSAAGWGLYGCGHSREMAGRKGCSWKRSWK